MEEVWKSNLASKRGGGEGGQEVCFGGYVQSDVIHSSAGHCSFSILDISGKTLPIAELLTNTYYCLGNDHCIGFEIFFLYALCAQC